MKKIVFTSLLLCIPVFVWGQKQEKKEHPNIIVILADDMGWGDVGFNESNSKIPTPHLDGLAGQGMVFSDAHSGASVCTPTRYGILTGRHCWRSRLKYGVLHASSGPLIEEGRLTLPQIFHDKGYATACFGKWHLGMGLPFQNGVRPKTKNQKKLIQALDWRGKVDPSPNAYGFDAFFGITVANPFLIVENDHFYGTCVRVQRKKVSDDPLKTLKLDELLPEVERRAISFIEARKGSEDPFFLYLPLTAPHTPIAPSAAFLGKSPLGPYGDFCMQVDSVVGNVLQALQRSGLEKDTLLIFTADNGCAPYVGVRDFEKKGHFPSGPYRGYKADIFEGGHRVPFIVRWPGKVRAGTRNAEPICLTDLMATFAEIIGADLPDTAAEDSLSILPAFLGTQGAAPIHEAMIHQSINGSLSIRQGRWKLERCADSGGWSEPRPKTRGNKGVVPASSDPESVQLYDLAADPAERKNVSREFPEVVQRLTNLLEKYQRSGRSVKKRNHRG